LGTFIKSAWKIVAKVLGRNLGKSDKYFWALLPKVLGTRANL
jgi:hypothetical protein